MQAIAPPNQTLDHDTISQMLYLGLEGNYTGQRVLVLIPDHTRTIPLSFLFRQLVDILCDAKQLDFMVALGTHPPLSEESLNQLVGISASERQTTYKHVGLLNHAWDSSETLTQIATLPQAQIKAIASDKWHFTLGGDVPVNINRYRWRHNSQEKPANNSRWGMSIPPKLTSVLGKIEKMRASCTSRRQARCCIACGSDGDWRLEIGDW